MAALIVSPVEKDRQFFRTALAGSVGKIQGASTCVEALHTLSGQTFSVVFCESEVPDGNWRKLLQASADLPFPPLLVVVSRLADEALWIEALSCGAYDVLMKPLSAANVRRVAALARQCWRNRIQDYLSESEQRDLPSVALSGV